MRKVLLFIPFLLVFYNGNGQKVTFYKDVAPIVHQNCTPCHRPGGAGPFPLITYNDVAKRAGFIRKVTQSRYMPPWQPDPHYRSFANERLLSEEEIQTISEWVEARAPEGKPAFRKDDVLARFVPGTRYHRAPDLTLSIRDTFQVKGDNLERYIVFKIPFELAGSKNVEAIEFVAGNKQVVHHANFAIHPLPDTSVDLYDTDNFVDVTGSNAIHFAQYEKYRTKMAYYGGWIPGTSYESYPPGMGWVLPERGVILLTIHLAPTARDEKLFAGVNFFFAEEPVERTVKVVSLGSGGIGENSIEPFFFIEPDTVKTFTLDITTPEDQSLLYIWPHMHLLGKEFRSYAVTPEGDTIPLVHIPDWDFKWQEIYKFRHLVRIPKGSVLRIEGTYDNTSDNPDNPFNPPRMVYSSGNMRTTDEMMTMILVFLPYREGDENIQFD